MRVVIFGGAGFVGLNIAELLLARGHAVTLFDQAELPVEARCAFAPYGERLRVLRGDVTEHSAVEAAVGPGCDAVVLGAAITAGAARDAAEPERILAVNLLAQVPILTAARKAKVRRVINLSSAASYGASGLHYPLLEETTPCDPQSLYAITKFASERVVARLSDLWQADVISVRLSGVFGPYERAGGVRDTPSPQALIVDCARRGAPALLSEPGARDWVYAADVAAAVGVLLDAARPRHMLYNISSGVTFTAEAWGKAFADKVFADPDSGFVCRVAVSGETPTVTVHGPTRAPLSVQRMADEFGWRAKFGCEESAEHMRRWLHDHDRGGA
ncbi:MULTISPECIES: NAD-dependent epimerase/dehydratase family protein [Bradyrhizobium]|uniref:NAD-dependent epimerase/dehydratase family protein n=1 Tax=Bradyrhizobium TaxID=374 RepID=UPI0003F9CDB3|nr:MULTISPECIES: NAD(P)-dependent oxidoreductase [Bradyrhizobium]QOG22394.1 NAD-dependent epimerase/dehydratase family protein [Bradyrhizobium sp. SEMIA]UFW52956.1 NAD(P)-dependent oxidoreductase [Bradyrhizobium arachidis]